MAWLRLIRWPNLLIVAGTQAVAWWCVIRPLPGPLVLTPDHFTLLCLSTVLIAAGGYIINDYFDIRIDAINKPEKMILDRIIPRRLAIIVHSVVNAVALALAAAVALPAGHPEWLLLQIGCTALLWRYSTTWKRQFMIGNVVVALMTGLTVLALILYEPLISFGSSIEPAPFRLSAHNNGWQLKLASLVLELFACFAFLLTWMREIVKDLEDYKGDDAEGCVTMPIKWGIRKTLHFVQALGGLSIILIVLCCCISVDTGVQWSEPFIIWMNAVVALPLLLWTFQVARLRTKRQFSVASSQIKWLMILGIISLLLFRIIPPINWDGFFVLPKK